MPDMTRWVCLSHAEFFVLYSTLYGGTVCSVSRGAAKKSQFGNGSMDNSFSCVSLSRFLLSQC
jgi:hypothetical protein